MLLREVDQGDRWGQVERAVSISGEEKSRLYLHRVFSKRQAPVFVLFRERGQRYLLSVGTGLITKHNVTFHDRIKITNKCSLSDSDTSCLAI
eukprot:scaffold105_cov192-Alexandrium_tamarense.AAC.5